MNQTQQYKLPQWEKTDRIVMEDFNDQARRLETALTTHDAALAGLTSGKADKTTTNGLQTQINQKAAASALSSAVSNLQAQLDGKIIAGAYAGDDTDSRTISLGFTPRAVLVVNHEGKTATNQGTYGGLAVTGSNCSGISIVTGGFRVYYSSSSPFLNSSYARYHYIAVR